MDFDSTSEQSSRYNDDWAGEKNVFLKSSRGFINRGSDYKNDFWLSVKFPANQYFSVNSMVLKKITHSCCTKRTINGFTLQYLSKGKWINYNNGEIIKTGQLPDDDVDSDRLIEFTPFTAQQVRITVPRNERSHGSAQGRIEFLIDGPQTIVKKETAKNTTSSTGTTKTTTKNDNGTTSTTTTTTDGTKTTVTSGGGSKTTTTTTTTEGGGEKTTTTTSGGKTTKTSGGDKEKKEEKKEEKTTTTSGGSTTTTTSGGSTTTTTSGGSTTTETHEGTDNQSAESEDGTCTTSTETTTDEEEEKTDTSVSTNSGGNFNETASKRAILDFGSTTDQSSEKSSGYSGEKWSSIKSTRGFCNK